MSLDVASQEVDDLLPVCLERLALVLGHLSTFGRAGRFRKILIKQPDACHGRIVTPLTRLEPPLVTGAELLVKSHDVAAAV